jgi:nitrogen regulatory protein PII
MSLSNNKSMDTSLEIFEMEDDDGVEAMTHSNGDVKVTVNVEDEEVDEVLAGKTKVDGKGTIGDRRKIFS